jgi:hypothetical protein
MGDVESLHELHDAYIWKVNAAVSQDRLDLALELADKYTDEALQLMTATQSAGCGRPDCDICAGTPAPAAPPAPRGWWLRGRARRHAD